VFGAGGGTSSYREIEDTDLVILWGSNARETHPIFFHHVLAAKRRCATLYVVDPRRTASAAWADSWLALDVGTDIPLANTIAREIIHAGLANVDFIERATTGFAEFAASVEEWTLERGAEVTGVAATTIRDLAHAYARAPRAQLCWTLGITEHHNAVDNVVALINLALLCGHVGRYGAGLNPLRGQNNVQGGGDMGAIPNRLPGFADLTDEARRAPFDAAWGSSIPPRIGKHLSQMFDAMEHGELRALYVMGENPAQSEADSGRTIGLLNGLDHLVVQDVFFTKTAEMADVVLPASAAWCESEGTVTNSERRVQRVRKALDAPAGARDDIDILLAMAARLGHPWRYGDPTDRRSVAEAVWTELRSLSPLHAGMSYARLEDVGGLQWPCPHEDRLEPSFLHGRLWADDPAERGAPAPFSVVLHSPPVDVLDDQFPIRLTTGRRLDSYNTGVQTGRYSSPRRRGETLDLSPADATNLRVRENERVRVVSRRGAVVAPVRIDDGLRAGLAFMTFHFPDDVDVNTLTIDAVDPRSGTAEFKASAIRVEKLDAVIGTV
jgi:predicted molibdopterin-dependent oxidoreductase YjgC